MTDATFIPVVARPVPAKGQSLPAPAVLAPPFLSSDVATPVAGETVLSLLWKRCADTDRA